MWIGHRKEMASSVCRQGESNPVLWLATRADKMELSCLLGTKHRMSLKKSLPESHIYTKSFIEQACCVKMAWFDLVLFCESLDLDSIFVHKLIKDWFLSWSINLKNVNIKPSWPHTWWITHMLCCRSFHNLCHVSWSVLWIASGKEQSHWDHTTK